MNQSFSTAVALTILALFW